MDSKRAASKSLTAILLILLASNVTLIVVGLSSYLDFENPYSFVPLGNTSSVAAMGITPKAAHAVVFVMDGMRADVFYRTSKPTIESYDDWANFTDVQCSTLISVSRTGYAVISSGVNSSESEVIGNDQTGLFPGDSLWNVTLTGGGTTGFVGSTTWWELFGPWMNYSVLFDRMYPGEPANMINRTNSGSYSEKPVLDYQDSLVSNAAQQMVSESMPTLLVVHFGATDEAGHLNGSESESYVKAFQNEDTYIGEVLSAYASAGILDSTLVVVVSDHGQVDYPGAGGEHGGTDPKEISIPLLIRGPGVLPGSYVSPHHQNSIAPTVAASLGLELPSETCGTPLFECLDFSDREEAVYRIELSSIRLAEAEARCAKMGYTSIHSRLIDQAAAHLQYAEGNFSVTDYPGAIGNAVQSEIVSRGILRLSWAMKVTEETSVRLAVASLVVLLLALVTLSSRRLRLIIRTGITDARESFVLVVSALSYFLFLLASASMLGWKYSASYLGAYVDTLIVRVLAVVLPAVALSLLAAFIVRTTLVRTRHGALESVGRHYIAVAVGYILILLGLITLNGPGLAWYASDVNGVLFYFFLLISGIEFALLAFTCRPLIRLLLTPKSVTGHGQDGK